MRGYMLMTTNVWGLSMCIIYYGVEVEMEALRRRLNRG